MLYPLTFKPIIVERIWGGKKLQTRLSKDIGSLENAGESWEISAVEGAESVVEHGILAGNNLTELTEVYMSDLVGEKVYEKFGEEFPLLIKYIDANDVLSIQVHPNDDLAKERHHAYGKTEMWYVIDAEPDAYIISGFNHDVTHEEYLAHLEAGNVDKLMNKVPAKPGDVFFIPAGRVHAIGKGVLLAEIQQTSDITYRIFDWNRVDKNGNPRQLHTEEALDAIDFKATHDIKISYQTRINQSVTLVSCPYFVTNILHCNQTIQKEYIWIDSFKILMCVQGEGIIQYNDKQVHFNIGSTILIPATIEEITIIPKTETKILEVFIDHKNN
ncbi:MAG: class I mannose-6-phosphate isomerase [Bacteroidales bacterium]|nr:class I mannose-6-phosphate isomerase [Bacteroidales bacterium]